MPVADCAIGLRWIRIQARLIGSGGFSVAHRRQSWLVRAQQSAAQAERGRVAQLRSTLAFQQAQLRAIRQAQIEQERDEKKRKALIAEGHAQNAAHSTALLQARIDELRTILPVGLQRTPTIDFQSLKVGPPLPQWHPEQFPPPELPPALESFLPPIPHGMGKLVPGASYRHQQAVADGQRAHQKAFADWQARESHRQLDLSTAAEAHRQAVEVARAEAAKQTAEVDVFHKAYTAASAEAVSQYAALVLERSPMPDGFPSLRRIAYAPQSRQLVVEVELPTIEIVPAAREQRYVKSRDLVESVARPDRERRALYLDCIAQTTVRILWELFESDSANLVDSEVVNGYVSTINPATGQKVRPCLISLRTTRDTLRQFDLSRVDAVACLSMKRGWLSSLDLA